MIPVMAKTELVMLNPRLHRTRPFDVLTPAATDKDPEIRNITDPQTVYPVYTEKGCVYMYTKCGTVTLIIITPKLRFIRAIRICTTPRTLGSPFRNLSINPFHKYDWTAAGCPSWNTCFGVVCSIPCMVVMAAGKPLSSSLQCLLCSL